MYVCMYTQWLRGVLQISKDRSFLEPHELIKKGIRKGQWRILHPSRWYNDPGLTLQGANVNQHMFLTNYESIFLFLKNYSL
jgi:hypothetical protein